MSTNSAIEWTDATWNPTTGCTKVSPACANCYIERTPPFRVRGRRFVNGHIPIVLHPDRLDTPLRRKKPTVYFVNSLSDLFHKDVPEAFIDKVFLTMALTRQHTYQVLTKRADRMLAYMKAVVANGFKPLPNVCLGVSVENQHFANERIPLLLQTPAAVRFISAEPLLGALDIRDHLTGESTGHESCGPSGWTPGAALDWIIVGAESGPRLRPTDPAWIRSIRDQCVKAGVPFFFKQWGGKTAKSGGRTLDGRTWDEMPSRG